MAATVEERVINLEQMMGQLIQTVDQTSREMRGFKDEMRDFKDEMLEFKNEMRDFKDEMLEFKNEMLEFKNEMLLFKNEMRDFKDEMLEFKNEMRDFKDEMLLFKNEMRDFKGEMLLFKNEMRDFKDEMHRFQIDSRKEWGELANRLGTMAEDLVAPSIPRTVQSIVDCPLDSLNSAVRAKRRNAEGQRREFDVVATCGDYLFINETKSRLTPESIKNFVESTLPTARSFFPEYADKQIIGIVASLYVDDSLVRYGEKLGLVVLGFGEDVMDVLNSPGFVPKTW